MQGKTLADVKPTIEQNLHVTVLGIGKEQKSVNLSDILSDDYSYLDQFIRRKFEEAGRGLSEQRKISIELNPPQNKVLEDGSFLIVLKDRESQK